MIVRIISLLAYNLKVLNIYLEPIRIYALSCDGLSIASGYIV